MSKTTKQEMLKAGWWVAIALKPGAATLRAVVGEIQAVDDRGVRITQIDWFMGTPTGWDFFAPWSEITSMLVATDQHDLKRFGRAAGNWQERMDKSAMTPQPEESVPTKAATTPQPPAEDSVPPKVASQEIAERLKTLAARESAENRRLPEIQ